MNNSNKSLHKYLIIDVFGQIEGISSKNMFGGYGYYKNGKIFGIIAEGKLYFKVHAGNKASYEERGSQPFTYRSHKGKKVSMSYYELPEDIMEDREVLEEWIEAAINP